MLNVSSVPQRSPFRYAGGKTWLVHHIRAWLSAHGGPNRELIEPFAGGGIVSLTAAFENLVDSITMVEKDEDVAAVWKVILSDRAKYLADAIVNFDLTLESAKDIISRTSESEETRAFATIIKNRVNRGGILADGASFIKRGENGKGIHSRWYPKTLEKRTLEIFNVRHKICFIEGDGVEICSKNAYRKDAVFFIDPPYINAGRRLYRYSEIDHESLFELASTLQGNFLMTYNDSEEIREMAYRKNFCVREVAMKTTHHNRKTELLISTDLDWLDFL